MKDDDTDNNFLDDLYSHSAKEIPQAVLDQTILKHAFDHVHKDNFFQRLQLQRVFSVAAVLVLSVYIVFDVGEQRIDVENFVLIEEKIRFESPAFDEESTVLLKNSA
jgi:mRNA-degrading endonuclease HigB of HigAB toxin-antitoxin module